MNEIEYGLSGEMHDIIGSIRDLLRESSNTAQNINTIMVELDTIRKKYRGEKISKGDYDIEGRQGTIYDKYEAELLKNVLNIKTEYWNPSWIFVSWEELFSKIDKINKILDKIRSQKEELETILIKSSEIKTRIDTIFKYLP